MPASKEHCRAYRQRLKNRVRAIFGTICQTCGADPEDDPFVRLQFAHIKPTGVRGEGRGMTRRLLDILKHPDHFVLECSDCHYMRDRYGVAGHDEEVPF